MGQLSRYCFCVDPLCFKRNLKKSRYDWKSEVFLRIPSHKLETSIIEGLDSVVSVLLEFCFAMLKAFSSPSCLVHVTCDGNLRSGSIFVSL